MQRKNLRQAYHREKKTRDVSIPSPVLEASRNFPRKYGSVFRGEGRKYTTTASSTAADGKCHWTVLGVKVRHGEKTERPEGILEKVDDEIECSRGLAGSSICFAQNYDNIKIPLVAYKTKPSS